MTATAAQALILCEHCSDLLAIRSSLPQDVRHQPDLAAFGANAAGCPLCEFIHGHWLDSIKSGHMKTVNTSDPASVEVCITVVEASQLESNIVWRLIAANLHVPKQGFEYVNEISVTTCKPNTAAAGTPIWQSSAPPSSKSRIATVRTWLADCDANHVECVPAKACLPKRLVDVVAANLVATNNLLKSNIRYATLSHCWGKNPLLCTLEANVSQFSDEIPARLLPRTFSQAMAVARGLGIPYLWIDALCIVQDDPEEWTVEAARMKDIYSGSVLTIAASDAQSSVEGIFPEADPARVYLERASPQKKGATRTIFTVQVRGTTADDADGERTQLVRIELGDTRNAASRSVLNMRGWVTQEQALSPRLVSWMRDELHWQCRTVHQTEGGVRFDNAFELNSSLPRLPLGPGLDTERQLVWRKWIEEYSRRDFTFWRDRTPAIAGLVEHYRAATGDLPVLGLWARSLPQDLLWVRLGDVPTGDVEDMRPPNVPSWSWLACPAKVSFDFWSLQSRDLRPVRTEISSPVAVLDWEVTWSGVPFTSQIASTRLQLEGPTLEVFLAVASQDAHISPLYYNVNGEELVHTSGQLPWQCAGQFDQPGERPPRSWTCMLVQTGVWVGEDGDEIARETFLILEPVNTKEGIDGSLSVAERTDTLPLVYRRVGLGCFVKGPQRFVGASRVRMTLV